jgi:hypothetical protein
MAAVIKSLDRRIDFLPVLAAASFSPSAVSSHAEKLIADGSLCQAWAEARTMGKLRASPGDE